MTTALRLAKFVLVVSCRVASSSDRQCPLVQTFLVISRVFATSTSIRVGEAAAPVICAIRWEPRGGENLPRRENNGRRCTETSEGSHLFFISILIDIDRSLLRHRRFLRPVRACLCFFFLIPEYYRTRGFLSRTYRRRNWISCYVAKSESSRVRREWHANFSK